MKTQIAFILLSALLPVACGQVTEAQKALSAAQSAVSSDDAAANQMYLDDLVDSAADTSTTPTTTTDGTVVDDKKAERMTQMAVKLMTELDSDASGSLSLTEFLVGPKKRTSETEVDAAVKAKIEAKLTEDFNKFAGTDLLLSSDELKLLLQASAPRIGCHRHGKGEDQEAHAEQVKKTAAEIIAEFDKDADGKLDATEFEALQAAKKAEVKAWRGENGMEDDKGGEEGSRRGHGRGGERPDGSDGSSDDAAKAPTTVPAPAPVP